MRHGSAILPFESVAACEVTSPDRLTVMTTIVVWEKVLANQTSPRAELSNEDAQAWKVCEQQSETDSLHSNDGIRNTQPHGRSYSGWPIREGMIFIGHSSEVVVESAVLDGDAVEQVR